jgi:hypothetical protein
MVLLKGVRNDVCSDMQARGPSGRNVRNRRGRTIGATQRLSHCVRAANRAEGLCGQGQAILARFALTIKSSHDCPP